MHKNIDNYNLDLFRNEIKDRYDSKSEDIFQQLTYDLLSFEKNDITFIQFPTAGIDGSIDHYGFMGEDKIIVECKKNNTYQLAKQALSELHKKLKENLAKKEAKENLYKPWFNTSFKNYFFCTSANVSNAKNYDDFLEKIETMFIDLSSISGLSHLKVVNISLYFWNDLKVLLEKDSHSYYKWIGKEIIGVDYLSDNIYEKSLYKQNLYNSKLPFISRDKFNKTNPENLITTEEEIYNQIFLEDSDLDGILIHGQGGVGKTRLMLELGFKAKSNEWIVLRINNNLKKLNDLDLEPNKKYCLLFDYIEENKHFETDIIDTLNYIFNKTTIKVIANSRTSYLLSNDLPSYFHELNLSPSEEYLRFITKEILKNLSVSKEFLKVKPSFAVFIKEDFKSNNRIYKNFQEYLKNRLRKTLNKKTFAKMKNEIFSLLASLAFTQNNDNSNNKNLKLLMMDGWIIEENEIFSSEHDSIIDELIELYLIQSKFTKVEKQKEIIKFVKTANNLYSTLRTLDRISPFIFEKKIADYSFFAEIIKQFDNIDKNFIHILNKTSLIDEKNRLEIFIEKKALYLEYMKSYSFIYSLSFTMKKLFNENAIDDKNLEEALSIWTNNNLDNIKNKVQSSRIISIVLKIYGMEHIISENASIWLENFYLRWEANFVLRALLLENANMKILKKYLIPWLEKFLLEEESWYLLQSWIEVNEGLEEIEKYLIPWLEKFVKNKKTHYILQSWIEANGNLAKIEKYLIPWLDDFKEEKDSIYVLQSWFNTNGNLTKIEKYLIPWLNKFNLEKESRFILEHWLKAIGDLEKIEKYLIPWIENFIDDEETRYLFEHWLQANGELKKIEKYLIPWLDNFKGIKAIDFILKIWLEMGASPEIVKPYIIHWIKNNPIDINTHFILKAWIEAEGELKEIEEYLLPWLEKYKLEKESSFILGPWIKRSCSLEDVEKYIFPWLDIFGLEKDSAFVLDSCLNSNIDLLNVEKYIFPWLDIFGLEKDASSILESCLNSNIDLVSVEKYILSWLDIFRLEKDAVYILRTYSAVKKDLKKIEKHLLSWVEIHYLESEAFILFTCCMKINQYDFVKRFIPEWIEKHKHHINSNYLIKDILIAQYELSDELLNCIFEWIIVNKDNENLDYVLKRVLKIPKRFLDKKNIPEKVLKIAFIWCHKNSKDTPNEVLFMLSYMKSIALSRKARTPYLTLAKELFKNNKFLICNEEVLAYETVMYYYCIDPLHMKAEDETLILNWILDDRSFNINNNLSQHKKYYDFILTLLKKYQIKDKKILEKINLFFNDINN